MPSFSACLLFALLSLSQVKAANQPLKYSEDTPWGMGGGWGCILGKKKGKPFELVLQGVMRQVETKPSFFENKVCSASSSTRNLYQEYDIFKTASEWGSGEWGQGKLKCYHALSWRFIWFFSWWSICLVAIKPWPVPRVLIKLILIVLANLFTVFYKRRSFGGYLLHHFLWYNSETRFW